MKVLIEFICWSFKEKQLQKRPIGAIEKFQIFLLFLKIPTILRPVVKLIREFTLFIFYGSSKSF